MRLSDVPRIDPIEPALFERDYRRPRHPVVLRGLVPADEMRRWSFESIAEEFRDVAVPTNVTRAGVVTPDRYRGVATAPRVLSDLLAQLGAAEVPSLYMMARLQELPAAWRERIAAPVYCAGAPWLASKVWLSPAGTVTLTHWDTADNLHLQLLGSKRFTLFGPSESAGLYPNGMLSSVPNGCRVDPEAPDLERYPRFRDVRGSRADLAPGDGLYIPRGAWHHVRTVADSLSVNFWWARGARLPLVVGADLFKRLRRIG